MKGRNVPDWLRLNCYCVLCVRWTALPCVGAYLMTEHAYEWRVVFADRGACEFRVSRRRSPRRPDGATCEE
ncbi:hypothetical protein GCM10028784_09630 [Myceligenerans cantabricum]